MRRITSCALTGVACVSMTLTASSPTTMPVFGSPSAVYAYACSESLSKLTFFSSRSACDANFFSVMTLSFGPLVDDALGLADRTPDAPALYAAPLRGDADQALDQRRELHARRVAVGAAGTRRALDEHREFVENR